MPISFEDLMEVVNPAPKISMDSQYLEPSSYDKKMIDAQTAKYNMHNQADFEQENCKYNLPQAKGKGRNAPRGRKFEPLEEGSTFKQGRLKLKDGSTVNLSSNDADKLNNMYDSTSNKKSMVTNFFKSKKSSTELLKFAVKLDETLEITESSVNTAIISAIKKTRANK